MLAVNMLKDEKFHVVVSRFWAELSVRSRFEGDVFADKKPSTAPVVETAEMTAISEFFEIGLTQLSLGKADVVSGRDDQFCGFDVYDQK